MRNEAPHQQVFLAVLIRGSQNHASGFDESLDRKSTRLNSSHTEIYTLSLHDALPISIGMIRYEKRGAPSTGFSGGPHSRQPKPCERFRRVARSEEHTSELQSHRDLHSFPTRRSSDLNWNDSL